jgi:hypothetical protein
MLKIAHAVPLRGRRHCCAAAQQAAASVSGVRHGVVTPLKFEELHMQ